MTRDLAIGESFHRMKRTLLLFCSAILIARIPDIDLKSASGVIGVAMEKVDSNLILALLWGAAAYYAVGLCLEAWSTLRLNSGLTRVAPMDNPEAAVFQALRRLDSHVDRLTSIAHELQSQTERVKPMLDNLGQWSRAIERLDTGMSTIDMDGLREGLEQVQQLPESYSRVRRDADRSISEATGLVTGLAKDMRSVARDISVSRRVQFYAWELGPSAVFFAVATYALPYPSILFSALLAAIT